MLGVAPSPEAESYGDPRVVVNNFFGESRLYFRFANSTVNHDPMSAMVGGVGLEPATPCV